MTQSRFKPVIYYIQGSISDTTSSKHMIKICFLSFHKVTCEKRYTAVSGWSCCPILVINLTAPFRETSSVEFDKSLSQSTANLASSWLLFKSSKVGTDEPIVDTT